MPKLITKLPEGKDPVICICFEKEFEARKTNADLVNKFKKDKYTIMLMPGERGRINLMLLSNDNQRLYKNLEYDYGKLTWWLEYTRNKEGFAFTHIYEDFSKHVVVKTIENNLFVLKVKNYTLANEIEFSL